MKKEFTYQSKRIIYHTYGSGKPVMLIHGFGETHEVWNNQAPSNSHEGGELATTQSQLIENTLLNKGFRFIIPELPGCGSDIIDDMSMEGMAEVLKEILDKEASPNPSIGGALDSANSISTIEKTISVIAGSENPPLEGREACIIGHSMGGYILLALAEKYPELISALGLFHSTAFADSEEKKAVRQKGIEFINKNGAFEFIKTTTPNLFSPNSKEQIPNFIKEYIESLDTFSPEALVKYYQSMMQRPDRTDVIRKTKAPVLMVMGKHDMAVPLNDGLKQCHLPEKVYIHILRHSGHMGMLEEPATTNCILEKFLTEN
jgi:pimeloyl-ACP methyl ester carboxylesterase